jgi:hypothetical protein
VAGLLSQLLRDAPNDALAIDIHLWHNGLQNHSPFAEQIASE